MDRYNRIDTALALLGDVDPDAVESSDDSLWFDRKVRRQGSIDFSPDRVGYYPNLAELVDQKLGLEERDVERRLADVLGGISDVPDVPADEKK